MWCINDSLNGYLVGFDLYTGAVGGRETDLGYRVVRQLARPFENTNRIIYCDRYFTSVNLFQVTGGHLFVFLFFLFRKKIFFFFGD